ncbi:MAG: O-antigen ligase family protein [Gaiellaceae bacterium]
MSNVLTTYRSALRGHAVPRLALGEGALAAIGGFGAVAAVAAAAGGYFQTSWGWSTLAFAWAAALALVLQARSELGLGDGLLLGAIVLLAGWTWLSTTWSTVAPDSYLEGEHVLVYVTGVAAALLVVRQRAVPQLLGGMLGGIALISAYGLATRLVPDRLGQFDPVAGYRLESPLGYWNALGIFAVMGALLALGFAARGQTLIVRAAAGASLAVLMPTLYFTFSRGSWVALALGLAAALALDPRRLQLAATTLTVGAAPAAAVLIASRFEALTHKTAALGAAAHDGHRLALVVLLAAVVAAGVAVASGIVERRVPVPRALRIAWASLLVLMVAAALGGAFARYGSPPTIARHAWHSFSGSPNEGTNLNARLFSLSGNGRGQLWTAAWHDSRAHPWLGSGAGSYEQWWLKHRRIDLDVRDAHSLYMETLAELGPVGLALLVLALVVPLVAAVRARRHRLVPLALSAYVAYLFHAAVDWDWEMTAVTLTALLCGVALVAAARSREARSIHRLVRSGAVAAAVAVAALAFVGLIGNIALARSAHAAAKGQWARSASQAQRAIAWAPWSSEALRQLGEAQLGLGQKAAARATFRRALAKNPRDSKLWVDLSLATEGSVSDGAYATAIRLDPRGLGR